MNRGMNQDQRGDRGKMSVEEAGRKGGETTLKEKGPAFYAEIGRKGGQTVSQDRDHMAAIGRRGGKARGTTGKNSNQ